MLSYNTLNADLERELSAGETLIWNGRPRQGLMLRATDALLIPFSLLWGGFAVFWEVGVLSSGAPFFFILWGIPFVLVGIYITVGRFFIDAYIRSKTVYGVTNERILIISGLLSRTTKSLPLHTLSEISLQQYRNGSGTITFGAGLPFAGFYRGFAWPGMDQRLPPAFDGIPEANHVYTLIRQTQKAI
jgi:hypothetical protein